MRARVVGILQVQLGGSVSARHVDEQGNVEDKRPDHTNYTKEDTGKVAQATDSFMLMSDMFINFSFIIATIFLTHKSFGRCYRVTTRMANGNFTFPRATSEVWHHLMMLFCFILWEILAFAQPFALEGSNFSIAVMIVSTLYSFFLIIAACISTGGTMRCDSPSLAMWRLVALFLKIVFTLYLYAILFVPELVIGRLLQVLRHMLEENVAFLSKGHINPRTFCSNIDTIRNSYYDLSMVKLLLAWNCN